MRMACVPIRDFFCKLCKWISSDKKGTVFKLNLVMLSKIRQTKRTSEIYLSQTYSSSKDYLKVKHV